MPDPNVPPPGPPTPAQRTAWSDTPIEEQPAGSRILDMLNWAHSKSPYGKPTPLSFLASADPSAGVRSRDEAMKTGPAAAMVIPENPNAPEAGYGSRLTLPPSSTELLEKLKDFGPYLAKGGAIQRVDKTRTNLGYNLAATAADEGAAATKDEAYWKTAEQQDLGGVAGKKEKLLEAGAKGMEERRKVTAEKVAKYQDKIDADSEYIRTHGKIDPYRTFQTNAAAGIFALLGSALMAGGAAARKDNSLDWTKQIDTMLEREAQAQIRMLENKKWSLTEAGQNVKRILDTSRDQEEAVSRLQAQNLGVLAERAAAITANAQSEIIKAQGKKAIAAIHEKLGEHAINIGIREQANESQENQAQLASSTQAQIANVGLLGTLSTNQTTEAANRSRMAYEQSKPVLERVREITKGWEDAHTALTYLENVLHDPKSSSGAKNDAVAAYSTAFQTFMGGTAGTVGARNQNSTFGVPTSFEALAKKLNHQPTVADLVREGRLLDAAAREKTEHVKSGKWTGAPIAADSQYTVRK